MAIGPLRVLVVDDSVETARMMRLLLKREGYEVKLAFDGPEAIELAGDFRPEVVLLDLSLPSMGGLEVAGRIKGISGLGGCVLVAISGYDSRDLGPTSPFEHHLTKPLDHDALTTILSRLRTPIPGRGPR